MGKAQDILDRLKRIRKPERHARKKKWCPHCEYGWRSRKRNPKKCPNCRRDLNPEAKVNVSVAVIRKKLPDLLNEKRFTPSVMKQLVDAKLYKYLGIPEDLPEVTAGREVQRLSNMKLADRFIKSELGQMEFGKTYKFESRSAIHFRLNKGFKTMAEHGSFQITEKGRQKVAEQKRRAEIAADKRS